MFVRFAYLTAVRLLVVMLLMTIGLHALAGSGPDIAPERGSAFSAGTTEMAILALRGDSGQQQAPRLVPSTGLPSIWLVVPLVLSSCAVIANVVRRPRSTAPPAAEWHPPAVNSRGPPLS